MTAYKIVQDNEGWSGQVAIDNNGGQVRYGINAKAFPNMPSGFYSGAMDGATALAVAQGHYRAVEWNGIMGDQVEDQVLANHLMDHAVNAGVPGAVTLAQSLANDAGASLALDGIMGPATLGALNTMPVATYRRGRAGYYAAMSFTVTSGKIWLPTWLARLKACG